MEYGRFVKYFQPSVSRNHKQLRNPCHISSVSFSSVLVFQYFLFLLVIFAAQLAAGILAAIYSDQITGFLQTEGVEFLAMDYGNNTDKVAKAATKGWDVIQDEVSNHCGEGGEGGGAWKVLLAVYIDQITEFLQMEGVDFLAMDYGNNTDIKVAIRLPLNTVNQKGNDLERFQVLPDNG